MCQFVFLCLVGVYDTCADRDYCLHPRIVQWEAYTNEFEDVQEHAALLEGNQTAETGEEGREQRRTGHLD